jgi:hypothetical protein
MTDYKSFKLPGDGTLRIRSEKIIATLSSANGQNIDIFCDGVTVPFHIQTTKKTPSELIDYIWNIPNFENEEDI